MPRNHPESELLPEVSKSGIQRANQGQLLLATPSFELLFACNGCADVLVLLVVEKTGAAVGLREAFKCAFFVLPDAYVELAGDTDVECAGVAAHDVGVTDWHGETMLAAFHRHTTTLSC